MLTRVRIDGMTCARCVQAVFTALTPVAGITRAAVGIGAAELEHDGAVTVDQLRTAIATAGYRVSDASEDRRRLSVMVSREVEPLQPEF